MSGMPTVNFSGKLSSVQVITEHTNSEIQPWINAISLAGANMEKWVGGHTVQTAQKIAVIIGQSSDNNIQRVIDFCENLFSDTTLSVRYFLMWDDSQETSIKHDRIRLIRYMSLAPNDFVEKVNRSLYKARLPLFLRTGYNVEICEELVEIQSVKYRKIILRSFKMAGWKQDVEYQSLHLFIHNKELYELTGETIEKIPETGSVKIRLWKHIEVEDSRFDATMSLDVFKNTDADE